MSAALLLTDVQAGIADGSVRCDVGPDGDPNVHRALTEKVDEWDSGLG